MIDVHGNPVVLYHGSHVGVDKLDCRKTVDGGLHFGTLEQAQMRNSRRLFHAHLDVTKARRSRDTGGNWKKKIAQAKAAGYDAIVYLNRYEGISQECFQQLRENGVDLEKITDTQFRKLVPQAQDSYIVFSPEQVRVVYIEDKPKKPRP